MKEVTVVLVGIGGYGSHYVKELLSKQSNSSLCTVEGAVDPYPDNSDVLPLIRDAQIPVYATIEQFYEENTADLAVISSPIQYHRRQICYALSKGSHVLCEKPISATVDDAFAIKDARDQANRFVAIGYQWSFHPAILQLKQDIMDGIFGRPKLFKTVALWPRPLSYYARGHGWAGKQRDQHGDWIMDSVANNATAHYLHNMFFVLGKTMTSSAPPVRLTAELYRANAIENFDTTAMRAFTADGVEILYYASHAVGKRIGPQFSYQFEHATIEYDPDLNQSEIIATFSDGRTKNYGNPNHLGMNKLRHCIGAIQGTHTIPCGPEAAMAHTICIHGMQLSTPEIIDFPKDQISLVEYRAGDPGRVVDNLGVQLEACYRDQVMPGECGMTWAQPGRLVNLESFSKRMGV